MTTTDFGRDISVTTSLRTGRFATGAQLVGEAAFRRLSTPRGMLRGGEEEANYGLDLTELIGDVSAKNTSASLAGRIRSELSKDERLLTVSVNVSQATFGPALALTIYVTATTADGPFSLQLLATDVTVQLLGITA